MAVRTVGPDRYPGAIAEVRAAPDTLLVTGWVARARHNPGVQSIWLTVDGVMRSQAVIVDGARRGDDELARGERLTWQGHLRRSDLSSDGTVAVGAIVLRGYGLADVIDATVVHLDSLGQIGAVDQPEPGAVVGDVVFASGWFRSSHGFDRIEVAIDGSKPINGRLLSQSRPDLAAAISDVDAPLAGWQAMIPIGSLARADAGGSSAIDGDGGMAVTMTVTAVGPAGRRELGRREVRYIPTERHVEEADRARVLAARTTSLSAFHRPDLDGLNILVATHDLGLGGGQLYLHELLRQLLRSGDVRCSVLSSADGSLRDELEELGATVHVVGRTPTAAVEYEGWLHQIAAVASSTGANVVLANTAGSFWGVDLGARLGLPSVWAVHESFDPDVFLEIGFHGRPDEWVKDRFISAFGDAGAVVFEAESTMQLFQHLIRDRRAVRIDYGIDMDRIDAYVSENSRDAVRRGLGISPDETLLMCMGTYEPRKAQGLLAVAFAQVAEAHPRATLAMVGDKGGAYSDAVHDVVDRLGMEERVRLIPLTADIDQWYLAADVFILASDVESLPRSMLEAMAFGTPVLASAVFGSAEVIEDGINGFLLDPSSVAHTARALGRVLSISRTARRAVGDVGRLSVREARDPREYTRAYRVIFDQLLASDDADLTEALRTDEW